MDIIEDRDGWLERFRTGWLAHLEDTGETDFKKRYRYVKNKDEPAGEGIDPAASRLLFVTSAGAYVRDEQSPFDAANPRGDPSIRTFPLSTPLDRIAFAHDHYDHRFADQDPQSILPLRHLEALEREGAVGAFVPTVVSFSGYLPDATQVVDEIAPSVLDIMRKEDAHVALLVPV